MGKSRSVGFRSAGFRIFPHTAEVALDISGDAWPCFYRNAARGLLAVYAAKGRPNLLTIRRIKLRADNGEDLLVAWLNELVYLISSRFWLPVAVRVPEAGPTGLKAVLTGGPMGSGPLRRVSVVGEIKSATFNDLAIRRTRAGLRARVVLDV